MKGQDPKDKEQKRQSRKAPACPRPGHSQATWSSGQERKEELEDEAGVQSDEGAIGPPGAGDHPGC